MKNNIRDLTFLIPVRIDSIERLENLIITIEFISQNFDATIMVSEANKYNNNLIKHLLPDIIEYQFIRDTDPVFHRTKYINILAHKATTPYVAIWDADIIISPKQIMQAIDFLRVNACDVAFPYDGKFYDVTQILRDIFFQKRDLKFLERHIDKMLLPYGSSMIGGALFIHREKYIAAGGENELFYGWGPEDWERVERWKHLGYRIKRAEGPLFHLSHPRDINGKHSSEYQKINLYYELNNTRMEYGIKKV